MSIASTKPIQYVASEALQRTMAKPLRLFQTAVHVTTGDVLAVSIATRSVICLPKPGLPPFEVTYTSSAYVQHPRTKEIVNLPIIHYCPPTSAEAVGLLMRLILSTCIDQHQPNIVVPPFMHSESAAREIAHAVDGLNGYFRSLTVVFSPAETAPPVDWVYDQYLGQHVMRRTFAPRTIDLYRDILTPSARL